MTRKVVVFNMGDNSRQEVQTSVTTWKQLLDNYPGIRNMVASDMKVVIKQTKTTIESDESVLPDDRDITIYLTPGKVKAGAKADTYRSRVRAAVRPKATLAVKTFKEDLMHMRDAVVLSLSKV